LILLKFGQNKVTHYKADEIKAKTDSSVVQTNIEFPVDTGLLYDSMQVLFRMMAQLSILVGCKSFRQSKKILKKLKKLIRSLHCTKKVELKKSIAKDIVALANKYANEVKVIIDSITIENNEKVEEVKSKFKTFIDYVFKFADQIERRIIKGEQIPHSEKVFSIFKPHTEWISKGKSGIICELGIKVLITTDQYNFIIGHEVMQNKSDVDVILDHIKKLLENQHITSLSCDKGFHSKSNQEELSKLVTNVVIPQKGKLSKERKDKEHEDIFIDTRKDHSEIESNINGLGSMGYAKCRDVSLEKFKTHVSVTVLARNLWNLGRFLIKKLKKVIDKNQ
jgi:hypothetical protein